MIDLRELDKFQRISMDEALPLLKQESRMVRLEVNTNAPAELWIAEAGEVDPEKQRFLCVVMGRDSVTFPAHGQIGIFADCEGSCYAWASEVEQTWSEVEQVSFTRPHKRNKMTPELTAVAEMLNSALEHRMGRMEAEVHERVKRELASAAAKRAAASAASEVSSPPQKKPDTALDAGNGSGGNGGTDDTGAPVSDKPNSTKPSGGQGDSPSQSGKK